MEGVPIDKLLNGEKVICPKCKKGTFVTDCGDVSKAHFFYCNQCDCTYHIDPIIEIQ